MYSLGGSLKRALSAHESSGPLGSRWRWVLIDLVVDDLVLQVLLHYLVVHFYCLVVRARRLIVPDMRRVRAAGAGATSCCGDRNENGNANDADAENSYYGKNCTTVLDVTPRI
jgi:hypothetical protein